MAEMSITKWSMIRRNELVDVPASYPMHEDFYASTTEEEARKAFMDIHNMFYELYTKMAEEPEYFAFPTHQVGELDYFSKEEQDVRKKPWDIFLLLSAFLTNGELRGNSVTVSAIEFTRNCKLKNIPVYLKVLSDYGFVFQGLQKGKLPKTESFTIEYPDNNDVLMLLYLVANKVKNVQQKDEVNPASMEVIFRNAFISWNYRIVADNLQTMTKTEDYNYVADKLHSDSERETLKALHQELIKEGYQCKLAGHNEGPCARYYMGSASTYSFAANEMDGKLLLEMRMKKMDKCLEYLKECNGHIKEMFLKSDPGCQNRQNGTCHSSIRFELDGEERWHCGCCGSPFQILPVLEEVPAYVKLVQLGK